MQVFVLGINDNPLMPTHPAKARKLIKEKKAVVIGYKPFTIQLTYETTEYTQPVTIGINTGARFIGIAIESNGRILAKGEIELRTDVSKLIFKRSLLRRARRSRKLRYREPRFSNRARTEGWLPPSVQSRIDNTIMWVEKFRDLLPNPKLIIEVGKFDVRRMEYPDIKKEEYQYGDAYGYYNTRYYVLTRDNYKCQICKGKSDDKKLQTHHIIFKSKGGSDMAKNLATVCATCHKGYHNGIIKHKFKKQRQYKETAFMNTLRARIMDKLDCELTYGYITAVSRKMLKLDKSHINDAIAITGVKEIVEDNNNSFKIKQFRKKKRSLHEVSARKRKGKNITQIRNEKNRKCFKGLYRNDKVFVNNQYGYIYGLSKMSNVRVKNANGDNIKMPNQKDNRINIKYLKFIHHNNNWRFDTVIT